MIDFLLADDFSKINYKTLSFSESRREFLFCKGLLKKLGNRCSAIRETFRCSVEYVIYSTVVIIKIQPSRFANIATGFFHIIQEGHKRIILKRNFKMLKI